MIQRLFLVLLAITFLTPGVTPSAYAQSVADALKMPQGAPDPARAAEPPRPAVTPITPDDLKARAAELTRRYADTDYDHWLRATEMDGGVESAFRLVRDSLRFESYPGVLRGAKGAYMSRAANAADRSLLLAEILNAKGYATRFATGRLPDDRTQALVDRIFEPAGDKARPATDIADSPHAADFVARLRTRAARDYDAILGALGDALPAGASPSKQELLDEIAAHVWVRADVNGAWVDLDTAFPDAEPGKAYCPAGETFDKLPAELHQRVTIRVSEERLVGGELQRNVLLEVGRPAAELVGRQVFLYHAPPADGAGGGVGGFGAAVIGGGRREPPAEWAPVLWIDGETVDGKPTAFDGKGAAGKKPARRGGGAFGGLGGGGDDDAPPAAEADPFVAEVLEFELAFPGGRTETTRRAIADRAGAAWRKAAPPDPAKLRPLPHDGDGPLAARAVHNLWFSAGRHDLAAFAQDVQALAAAVRPAPPPGKAGAARRGPDAAGGGQATLNQQLWLMGMQNLPVVLWGDHAFVPALNDDPAVRFYADSPRILLFSLTAGAPAGDTDEAVMETLIDLRRDKVRGVARGDDPAAAAAVARRKIWYGVLGGALEHETVARHAALFAGDKGTVASTSALLDGRGAELLRPPAGGGAPDAPLCPDPDTAAVLAAALARDEAAVVPKSVLAEGGRAGGFWAVSLATGDVRAVWGDDLHATGGRYSYSGTRINFPNAPGTSGTSTHVIDPKNLTSRRIPPPQYRQSKARGGREYETVLLAVAINGKVVLEYTLTHFLYTVLIAIFAMWVF